MKPDSKGWSRWFGRCLAAVLGLVLAPSLHAHIGSPTVFFEGPAGPYSLRIVVRPPGVIPGLAEVSVRVESNAVDHVTALPVRWNTGRQGAPPPDEAVLVRGETNLYSTQLWFMQGGAQSVEVKVTGRAGTGEVIVPVNAVATRVLEMPRALGRILSVLAIVLVLLLAAIIGAAVRESRLPAGQLPSGKRRWLARSATLLAAVTLVALIWLGKRWWDSEAANYRNNRLYRPLEMAASVRSSQGRPFLRLELADEKFQRGAPLVPDHGKLMHLFLMREPGLDSFAHLHPVKLDWKTFETPLPSLPAGRYRIYSDITSETGFADTLTTTVVLNEGSQATPPTVNSGAFDPDDAWCQAPALAGAPPPKQQNQDIIQSSGGAGTVDWLNRGAFLENQETAVRFRVHDALGRPAAIEPYMGMAGHLVLRRDDGSVFTHLHPGGSFSMAAQQLFQMRAEGKAPLKAASATNDPVCRLPTSQEIEAASRATKLKAGDEVISFPYAFPKAGRYRLWFQVKVQGEIQTRVFDADVQPIR